MPLKIQECPVSKSSTLCQDATQSVQEAFAELQQQLRFLVHVHVTKK